MYPTFPDNVFPIGTHVYREPYIELDEVLRDLPLLARLGFNMIKIQESWSTDEPSEGRYRFERIARIIERAQQLHLGVYLGLTMEQAPAWLWRKFPDAHMQYANGLPHNDPTQYLLPADGKPGPCWYHPGAREAGERFIAALVRDLGRFENIWVWNTWQEIGFWPHEGGTLGLCYNPHTLARFRNWLSERYRTLDALNGTWYTTYGAWEEIEPPRRFAAVPSFIDWRYFMENVYIFDALTWKTQTIKAHDPLQRPVFSHVAGPGYGPGAPWRWSRAGDFFGDSNYPAWGGFHRWDDVFKEKSTSWHISARQEMWQGIILNGDITRSATGRDRAFWGAEFQGGPISQHLHLGRVPSAADIRRWMLAGLAAGMNGISFWNHRAERLWSESNGFGLLDPQGETTERIEEAGRIARAINAAPDIFSRGQLPRAQVALLVNDQLFHFCEGTADNAAGIFSYNLRGHADRLWRLGIPFDFVEAEEVQVGALSHYKAALLPMPLALDPAYFAHLRNFVEQGGTLISEACPGRFDAYGICTRAQMVAGGEELFGARHLVVQIVREPNDEQRWTPQERVYGEFAPETILTGIGDYRKHSVRASFYLQTLLPTTGSVILQADEQIAGVEQQVGAGRAILLGTYTGLCSTAHAHQEADLFIEELLHKAGVDSDRCGKLIRRRRVLEDREAWLLVNESGLDVSETIDLESFTYVSDLLDEPLSIAQNGTVTVTVAAADIRCLLLAHEPGD